MSDKAIIKTLLVGALLVAVSAISPVTAQSTLGGAKAQQNKIGGAAKPQPALGGPPPSPATPKPAPVVNTAKPGSPTSPTLSSTGTTMASGLSAGNAKPNPPVTLPSKGGPVVTSNLKCASGACTSKGPKP